MNIWQSLPKPIISLAPMEDVTDTVFRQIIIKTGRPDLFFTEFTSCEGLIATQNTSLVSHRLNYQTNEHPIVAQIWGKSPEAYYFGAKQVKNLGFDGVDLNMGCPVRKIVKQGCCSALIKNPTLAKEIIDATKEASGDLPVSVKTRIGFSKVETENWIGFLLEQDLDAITVHGRLAKDMSKKPADWEEVGKAVKLRDSMEKKTLIMGNGDVNSLETAQKHVNKYKVDGVMIGRGALKDPWIFNENESLKQKTKEEKIELLILHLKMFDANWRDVKRYPIMKKFFKVYLRSFPDSVELRNQLYETESVDQALDLLTKVIK